MNKVPTRFDNLDEIRALFRLPRDEVNDQTIKNIRRIAKKYLKPMIPQDPNNREEQMLFRRVESQIIKTIWLEMNPHLWIPVE